MLQFGSHWRFALNGPLERERRLLAFASGSGGAPGGPDPIEAPVDTGKLTPQSIPQQVDTSGTHENIEQLLRPGDASASTPDDDEGASEGKSEVKGITEELKKIAAKANELENQIDEMIDRMDNDDVKKQMEKMNLDPKSMEAWKNDVASLKTEKLYSQQDKRLAEDLQKLWRTDLSPEEFLESLEQYGIDPPNNTARALHGVLAGLVGHNALGHDDKLPDEARGPANVYATKDVWKTRDQSEKYRIVQEISTKMDLPRWIATTKRRQKEQQEVLVDYNTKTLEEAVKQIQQFEQDVQHGTKGGISEMLGGIRFYSVMDYVRGVKQYWEALKSTWEQRGKRYSATIAARIGKTLQTLPFYGQEVNTILDGDLEHTRQEESKKMQEHLEHTKGNWHVTFHELGIHLNNPNKARGILDYAAQHGWLYEIDELGYRDGHHPIFTMENGRVVTLEEICSDWRSAGEKEKIENYFDDLRGRNSKGRDEQIEAGKAKENDNENVPRFIKLLEHEMDDFNLWTAAGVVRRAMQRVLMGEVAPWLLTTIMKKLKQYPHLRRITPVAFWDIVGKESMYTTTFTLGWAKAKRPTLRRWCITGDDKLIDKTELYCLDSIEREIKEKDPKTDYESDDGKEKLARLVAKVLACQTVQLPGGFISIFETKYKRYRDGCSKYFISFPKALDEDSDAYTERTEQPLLSLTGYKDILKYSSTRTFENPKLAATFLEKLIIVKKELESIEVMEEAAANLTKEVQYKINDWSGAITREQNIQPMLNEKASNGKSVFCFIFTEGLISWESIKGAAYEGLFLMQLKKDFGDYYQEHMKAMGWPENPVPTK